MTCRETYRQYLDDGIFFQAMAYEQKFGCPSRVREHLKEGYSPERLSYLYAKCISEGKNFEEIAEQTK